MREPSGESSAKLTERRTFLGILLGGVGLVVSAAAAWPVWRFLAPRTGSGELEKISISRAEIPLAGAHFFSFHGKPAVLLQSKPGQFAAFSAVCTHLGCVIKWVPEKGEFLCPCHAGRFSVEGKVLGGPPPEPLSQFHWRFKNDNLVIALEKENLEEAF
jgi:cytochrome b6-f complex iron-sulfur subunit